MQISEIIMYKKEAVSKGLSAFATLIPPEAGRNMTIKLSFETASFLC
jgi:hypothetical protein